jgi:hypothetical protein
VPQTAQQVRGMAALTELVRELSSKVDMQGEMIARLLAQNSALFSALQPRQQFARMTEVPSGGDTILPSIDVHKTREQRRLERAR